MRPSLNLNYIIKLPGKLVKITARNFEATQKNVKPRIDPKDGVVGTTSYYLLLSKFIHDNNLLLLDF